ncbi:hypothetical protein M2272_000180 [Mycobacterium frederiksbergense]|uniref:PucR family transcriptional regulator n=1 Tax=Mycolicibacterium frederiksbergense TaxID=117567 RepID=A0ABT6KS49_9MYCO|nr:PucR family transcriptional regulator [Mycolicibacterium frederiksbergense]MDH6193559.1 hypothetical protein [Mycolicibacterium frederiksbergense]
MPTEAIHTQLAEVACALEECGAALGARIAKAVVAEVRTDHPQPEAIDVMQLGCAAHIGSVVSVIAGQTPEATAAAELGTVCARDGVSLALLLGAYRVVIREVWAAAVEESANRYRVNGDLLRILTAKIFAAHDILANATADAYQAEQARLVAHGRAERSVLIDSVLHGRPFDEWSVWEAAELLRLPSDGPFVVVAAEVAELGSEALPGIESKLRSMDVFSAWRLLPDLQVGIVHIRSEELLDQVLALMSRMSTGRIGVSARFDDLREAADALRYARVTLRGRPDPGVNVTVFDGSILATAAVSAPEVMVKLAAPIIDCFSGLADSERDVLFDTFRVWLDNDGSLREAGRILFCHPNTVRYRLHRIEQRTGRSLTRPRDVAEMSLAFEVHRRLMWHQEDRPDHAVAVSLR